MTRFFRASAVLIGMLFLLGCAYKWSIETEDTFSFPIVFSGSKFLIEEFPNSEDYLENTKDKIQDI